jgi:tryptophan synthase alpha chain
MRRINKLFNEKNNGILSIYFTAGFPGLNSTREILSQLQESGVDLIEIGIPFSDPLADGPVIQQSSQKALENGMNLKLLFEQLKNFRDEIHIPVLLMGYLNPVMQFGVESFAAKCKETGIDGAIIPDLPLAEFEKHYQEIFAKNNLKNIFLVSPQTSEERLQKIDAISDSFIYLVSSNSTTGAKKGFTEEQLAYFRRMKNAKLKNPTLIGFGISDAEGFNTASAYSCGAIVGSAFVKRLETSTDLKQDINEFVNSIKQTSIQSK